MKKRCSACAHWHICPDWLQVKDCAEIGYCDAETDKEEQWTSHNEIEQCRNFKDAASVDVVAHPSHYTGGGIECKEAMKAAFGGANGLPAMAFYWWGCAFKYLWRWRYKNGKQDLEKCKQCIDFLIDEIEGE